MRWWLPFVVMAAASGLDSGVMVSLRGGSYNSFMRQVGFCKAQSFDTVSRNTSSGPSIFQSGRVSFGVGLSHAQFNRSVVSCGRCMEILTVDRFYEFDGELTEWNYDKKINGNFTVMVMDECTDPICESGFLDFDIYNTRQPVARGNPTNLTWRYVPCPVNHDHLGFLFCMGYESCQAHDAEGRMVAEVFQDAAHDNWVRVYPRNTRISIIALSIQGQALSDNQSWLWSEQPVGDDPVWLIEWQNADGTRQSWVLDWTTYFDETTTPGYRGGFVVHTDLQN